MSRETEKRKQILINIILVILRHPISGLSQHPENSTQHTSVLPRSHKPARRLIEFLSFLTGDMLRDILEFRLEGEGGIGDGGIKDGGCGGGKETYLSLGIYLYLVFGENMLVENIPQVYSHPQLLSFSNPYIRVLLENQQEIMVFKGVLLLKSLLQETHLITP